MGQFHAIENPAQFANVGAAGTVLTRIVGATPAFRVPIVIYSFDVDQLQNPATGWPFTVPAEIAVSTNDTDKLERLHDDTAEEGSGTGTIFIPAGITGVIVRTKFRAETAPGAARTVGRRLYGMTVGTAVGAWSAAVRLDDVPIATDELYVTQTQTINIADLGLTADEYGQISLSRAAPLAGIDLTGDAGLAAFTLTFFGV